MIYYAAQVHTGHEQKFIDDMARRMPYSGSIQRFVFLRRELRVKRQGVQKTELQPLFPGYIFIESDGDLDPASRDAVRSSSYFYRFLKSNKEITPLADHDLRVLHHFMDFGEKAGASRVYFDKDQRIVVADGPLKGLEGNIIKVDRRKQRAKIQITFENTVVTMDLAFSIIEGTDGHH